MTIGSSCKRSGGTDICSNQKTTEEETLAGRLDLKVKRGLNLEEAKVEINKSGFHFKSHEGSLGEIRDENVQNQEMTLWSSFDLKSRDNGQKESRGENDESIDVQNLAHAAALWSSFEVKRRDKSQDKSWIGRVPDENEDRSNVQEEAMGRRSRTPRDESGFIFLQKLVKFSFSGRRTIWHLGQFGTASVGGTIWHHSVKEDVWHHSVNKLAKLRRHASRIHFALIHFG